MKLHYADTFVLPLPPGHRFPMEKYARLRERLAASGRFTPGDLRIPAAADDDQIGRAHVGTYLRQVCEGTLDRQAMRRIGFPWSPAMVERSRRSAGATIAACRCALEDGVSANLAGGTHHAHRDFGAGFCVFNDAAIAARQMQAEAGIGQVAIIDCDVHQGDGTAAILAGDRSVFTFSLHGAHNFPFDKQQSDLDLELADGVGDDHYLEVLAYGLDQVFARCVPELVIYLAGADPYADDRLGRLSLSIEGLQARDRLVLGRCADEGVPVALAMAGGYGRDIGHTVEIHANTVLTAAGFARRS
ncbi:MAG: histone deacetylase [Rhodocyclaceae bacterium]|nr:histone deacetylase [Rhodocyclaceae bacterium]